MVVVSLVVGVCAFNCTFTELKMETYHLQLQLYSMRKPQSHSALGLFVGLRQEGDWPSAAQPWRKAPDQGGFAAAGPSRLASGAA